DRAFGYLYPAEVWWYASPDVFHYCIDRRTQQIHVPAETVETFYEKYGNDYNFVGDIKTITDMSIPTQTYTGAALTPMVKDGENTLTLGEDYTITLPKGGCTNAGEYTVTLTGNKRYYKTAEKIFTIAPAPVTVTAEDKTKAFGEADPTFTAKVSGLVNNESADLIKYTITRAEGENVGEYAITAKGDAKQGNYVVSFVDGKLTIKGNPGTPVASVADAPMVKVWSYNSTIYIESAPDTKYTIIDLNGRILKSSTTKSTKEEITINKPGIVVVNVDGYSYKVAVD
ncbi:MAG: hypothetical protein J5826_06185, partial [Bacteroidales bacterium]|nr:hypothetical protein [Bacteroidales bacterium]